MLVDKRGISDSIILKGKRYQVKRRKFQTGWFVELLENGESIDIAEHTSKDSFLEKVTEGRSIDEQIIEWALYMLSNLNTCSVCGKDKIILCLTREEYEEHPEWINENICSDCKNHSYFEAVKNLWTNFDDMVQEEKAKAKLKGYTIRYVFWVHPKTGEAFPVEFFSPKVLTNRQMTAKIKELQLKYNAFHIREPEEELI